MGYRRRSDLACRPIARSCHESCVTRSVSEERRHSTCVVRGMARTLNRARDAIRAVKNSDGQTADGVTVIVHLCT